MNENDQQALAIIPIIDVLPELRDDVYADVCAWDAERMALRSGYDAADGAYLAKIQVKLAPAGLWTAYLKARKIAERTAYDRIAKAEGRYVESISKHGNSNQPVAPGATARQLSAAEALLLTRTAELERVKEREAKAQADYIALNHELAAAHGMIKRLKDSGKTEDAGPRSARVSGFEAMMTAMEAKLYHLAREKEGYTGTFEEFREQEKARRQAKEAEEAAERKAKAKEDARYWRSKEGKARREAEEAAETRKSNVRGMEYCTDMLGDCVAVLQDFGIDAYTDEQRESLAAAVTKLRALADSIEAISVEEESA